MCLRKWSVLVWPWSTFCPRTAVVRYPLLKLFLVTLPGEDFPSRIELQPCGQASSSVEADKQGSQLLFLKLFLQHYFYSGRNQENLVLLKKFHNICWVFFFFSFLSLLFCSPLDALLCYPVSEKGLETAKYWMLWPWLSWKYFFVHLILNNLRSAVDTECLGAGKLARHLCGHLGPAGVGAEGGSSREVLTGLTGRRARIGVASLQGRHSFVLYTSVICPCCLCRVASWFLRHRGVVS